MRLLATARTTRVTSPPQAEADNLTSLTTLQQGRLRLISIHHCTPSLTAVPVSGALPVSRRRPNHVAPVAPLPLHERLRKIYINNSWATSIWRAASWRHNESFFYERMSPKTPAKQRIPDPLFGTILAHFWDNFVQFLAIVSNRKQR